MRNTVLTHTTVLLSSLSILAMMSAPTEAAMVLNLTNDTIAGHLADADGGGEINGGHFTRASGLASGSGAFRDIFRVQSTGVEAGYNRDGFLDGAVPSGFDSDITVGDLITDVTGSYYVFAGDLNESSGGSNSYISLDKFQVWVGDATDPVDLPTSLAELDLTFGDAVYDMDEVSDHTVLMDASLESGSGVADFLVYVPVAAFATSQMTDLVYLYTEFGGYDEAAGFGASGGAEQFALYVGDDLPGGPVPEPAGSAFFTMFALLALVRRARR